MKRTWISRNEFDCCAVTQFKPRLDTEGVLECPSTGWPVSSADNNAVLVCYRFLRAATGLKLQRGEIREVKSIKITLKPKQAPPGREVGG